MKKLERIKNLLKCSNLNNANLNDLRRYYSRYTLLPKLMGFKQEPTAKYKLSLIYDYLRYSNCCWDKDSEYVLNCLPQLLYSNYLSHKTGHYEFGHECINKQYFYQILEKHNLPFPKTYFIISENQVKNLDNDVLSTEVIDSEKTYFAKPLARSSGEGACIIKSSDMDIKKFEGYIFQEKCSNHKLIKKLAPNDAFNTVRIVTYNSEKHNKTVILSTTLKLGQKNSLTDVIGTGGTMVPIDNDKHCLKKYGYNLFTEKKFEKYPESDIVFENFELPYWYDLLKVAKKASRIFGTRLIGWDIGITDEGIKIVEGNSGGSYLPPQAFDKPFYDTLLISDYLAESEYHEWIKKYEKNFSKKS